MARAVVLERHCPQVKVFHLHPTIAQRSGAQMVTGGKGQNGPFVLAHRKLLKME
jgi:hypothetical protein